MAIIQDPNTATGAKVNADGSLQVSSGGDGLSTYSVQVYHPRLTGAVAVGSIMWAMRAGARTVVVRGGQIRLGIDVTPGGQPEVGIEIVRFSGADPTGGIGPFVATKKQTANTTAATTAIRGATDKAGLTLAGATIDPTLAAIAHVSIPAILGTTVAFDVEGLSGLELAPGEGLALRTNPAAAPVGLVLTGYIEFSER